ncbi:hypothetical protein ACFLU6_04680 [Acidobacteriota bacterium]
MKKKEVSDREKLSKIASITDLVISLLSVNAWTVEKSYSLLDGLRREGLLDMDLVSKLDESQIFLRLKKAGFNRGDFVVGLMSERIAHLARSMEAEGLECFYLLHSEDKIPELDSFLLGIKGIGPHVLRNYKMLIGI